MSDLKNDLKNVPYIKQLKFRKYSNNVIKKG